MLPGWMVSMVMLIPYLLCLVFRPVEIPSMPIRRSARYKLAVALEGIGQLGIFILPIFYTLNPDDERAVMGLILMGLALGMNYLCWGRYFFKGRAYRLLFQPMFDLPVPLAVSLVIYFLSAGLVLHSIYLMLTTCIFATGHIYKSYAILRTDP
jgi:hypothetical protein